MLRRILTIPWRLFLTMLVMVVTPAVFIKEAIDKDPEEASRVVRNAYIEIWSL